ncbi:hypothetical protein PG985_011005 [Apiospora marii]|uniref:Uncharacterized protein n=1 Tax=Apiospora marii TaxID=335849 RepID=A0ABR1SSG1_9PEZI
MCRFLIQHHIYHSCKLANYEPERNRAKRASGTEGTAEQEPVGNQTPVISGAYPNLPFFDKLRGKVRNNGEVNEDAEVGNTPLRQPAPTKDEHTHHRLVKTIVVQCPEARSHPNSRENAENGHCPGGVCVAIEKAEEKALQITEIVGFDYTVNAAARAGDNTQQLSRDTQGNTDLNPDQRRSRHHSITSTRKEMGAGNTRTSTALQSQKEQQREG